MKKKIILSSILALGVLGGVVGLAHEPKNISAATPEVLYLTPNSNWKEANARFAAYFFGNGEKWVSMTDPDGDKMYEVTAPAGYPNVIFCRMNPSASANNWNNTWNQTSDLTIPTNGNNWYTVKEGTWSKGGGTWGKYNVDAPAHEKLTEVFNTFYNDGYYKRDTIINIDTVKAGDDLKMYFHNNASDLERTTYFEGDRLWMTNENGVNSGYGTDGTNMYHFKYENEIEVRGGTVTKNHKDWDNPEEDGMEGFYITLKDIKESISETQKWTGDGEKYSSTDAELINKYLAFTAPCFLNYHAESNNKAFTWDRVEVEKEKNYLYLRLYVKADTKGWLKSNSDLVFSEAKIETLSGVYFVGSHNNWSNNPFTLMEWNPEKIGTEVLLLNKELSTTNEFKIYDRKSDKWIGYDGVKSGSTGQSKDLVNAVGDNISVKNDGTYNFYFSLVEEPGLWIAKA